MKQDEEDPEFRPLCKLERGPGDSKQDSFLAVLCSKGFLWGSAGCSGKVKTAQGDHWRRHWTEEEAESR